MKYVLFDDDGYEETVELPSKFVVCWRCEGKGVHDCWEGGMTGDEMAEQGPDFYEDYMNGVHDTRCTVCNGRNVVEEVDRDRCAADLLARYDAQGRELDSMRQMEEMERRMGC